MPPLGPLGPRRVLALALLAATACGSRDRGNTPPPSRAPAPTSAGAVAVAPGAGRRAPVGEKPEPLARIDIPAGRFVFGSTPGDEGRDPSLEPTATQLDVPAFGIDARPYPGEAGKPPLTGLSAPEAARRCAERGARLCTEVEWERACRGAKGEAFSTGTAWDPTCTSDPDRCASSFGVRSLGVAMQEWTASVPGVTGHPAAEGAPRLAITKGAHSSSPAPSHRCAARHAINARDASARGGAIGFRCCTGPSVDQTPAAPAIEGHPAFRPAEVPANKLGEILGGIPQVARLRPGARYFPETDVARVLGAGRAAPEGSIVTTVTTQPVLWSPEPGTEIVVATGRSRGGAFVVALHKVADDDYRLASSFVLANEQGPIVLAYRANAKREIAWSTCWECPGEGGAVTYRDDHRVVIVQR